MEDLDTTHILTNDLEFYKNRDRGIGFAYLLGAKSMLYDIIDKLEQSGYNCEYYLEQYNKLTAKVDEILDKGGTNK